MTVNPEASVILPSSLDMRPKAEFEAAARDFCGVWAGELGEGQLHVLIVEKPLNDGALQIVMAIGDSSLYGVAGKWWRVKARIVAGDLVPDLPTGWNATARYRHRGNDSLISTYAYASGFHHPGIVERTSLRNGAPIRYAHFGAPVRIPSRHGYGMEGTLYLPANSHATRLAIFNHGSAIGADRLRTWREPLIASWLLGHGYAVLVPMRRGRGRSDGLYIEDAHLFADDGTPLDISPGVEAALEDLEDAVAFARKLLSPEKGPVLHLGQSRGGFLATVHAGRRPDDVSGVINFVGGWMGGPVAGLNTPWFARAGQGAGQKVPQLWIYGAPDAYYDEAHTRQNFQAFTANGGRAELIYHTAQQSFDGHSIRFHSDLWRDRADRFVRMLR